MCTPAVCNSFSVTSAGASVRDSAHQQGPLHSLCNLCKAGRRCSSCWLGGRPVKLVERSSAAMFRRQVSPRSSIQARKPSTKTTNHTPQARSVQVQHGERQGPCQKLEPEGSGEGCVTAGGQAAWALGRHPHGHHAPGGGQDAAGGCSVHAARLQGVARRLCFRPAQAQAESPEGRQTGSQVGCCLPRLHSQEWLNMPLHAQLPTSRISGYICVMSPRPLHLSP